MQEKLEKKHFRSKHDKPQNIWASKHDIRITYKLLCWKSKNYFDIKPSLGIKFTELWTDAVNKGL